MSHTATNIIDLVFDLEGQMLTADYPFELWDTLCQLVPALSAHPNIGVLPLRSIEQSVTASLPKRAKLVLRIPSDLADTAAALSGRQLNVSGNQLKLGVCKHRAIKYYPTIHAQLVTGDADEMRFINEINQQFTQMGISGKIICGKRHTLSGPAQQINGYSLVLHDLTPEASMKLQHHGLGESRQFGCGIFVPYKVISSLE
ncbi:MAG: type I-MYXAN CRISPR-associated protein Cas6/Cmx6 [Gallionella sp.]|jgi:CRISPR-associated protein Cas6